MAFEAFDYEKKGCISVEMVGTILTLLGHELSPDKLKEIIKEIDEDGTYLCDYSHVRINERFSIIIAFILQFPDMSISIYNLNIIFLFNCKIKIIACEIFYSGSGELEFGEFCTLAKRFLTSEEEGEEETEAMDHELREAFRLYDKEGNGYITTAVFRDILHELDEKLTSEELDIMIEDIDTDGSGTLDFDGEDLYQLTEDTCERETFNLKTNSYLVFLEFLAVMRGE